MTKINKKQLYVIAGLAGIIATAAAFAFPLQTVIAPHPCIPGVTDLDTDGIPCDLDPDDHNPLCPPDCASPPPEPACIPEHWDKIIFQILRDPSGEIMSQYLKTPLDIKVLDEPSLVANIDAKIRDFIIVHGIANVDPAKDPTDSNDPTVILVNNLKIDIIDVEYAIVCIPVSP